MCGVCVECAMWGSLGHAGTYRVGGYYTSVKCFNIVGGIYRGLGTQPFTGSSVSGLLVVLKSWLYIDV